MKFLCLGYLNEAGWNLKSKKEIDQIMSECLAYDEELKQDGHFLGGHCLQGAADSRTVKIENGEVTVTDGPYPETKELIGGVLYLRARDMDKAQALISKHPGLGVGPFEIRPVEWTTEAPTLSFHRTVPSSSERVFRSLTDPNELRNWWGPRTGKTDWTTPSVEFTPERGAIFRTCIRSPEGAEFWAQGEVVSIEPGRRLSFTHKWEQQDTGSEEKLLTFELDELGENTSVRLRIEGFQSESSRATEAEGWHECMDRLVEYLRGEDDEAVVRALVAEWSKHVAAKDSEKMMEQYHEDVVLYDAIPPYKTVGRDAVKKAWDSCFPHMPDKCGSEHRDLEFKISGDLAVVNGLHRFRPEAEEHPCGKSYLRITVVFQRFREGWRVVHEHVSNPFNPLNNQVWSIENPEVLDQPDYSSFSPS